jgi:hypothetical protein
VADNFSNLYDDAREVAAIRLREHAEDAAADALPPTSPYTLEQVLARDWYPTPPR